MFCSRRVRLSSASVFFLSLLTAVPSWCQSQAQSSSPAPQPPSAQQQPEPAGQQPTSQQAQPPAPPAQQPPEQQPKPPATQQPKTNPFENVPEAGPQQQQKPAPEQAKPQLEAPKAPETAPPTAENVVEMIEFRGARRVPQDTLRALIMTKKGDIYNEDALHGDFMRLWNTGRFDDIRLETEQGKTGMIVRFVLTERRVVRSIKYSQGMKSVSQSEVLDRFKERKVGLTVESQYDPNKVQRAAVVLKEYLAERGRQFATVDPEIRQIPPSSLEVTFNVNEGPKVKVGTIDIQGNKAFSDLVVIRAMKNLHPIGIPHSIFFESIFAKTYDSSKLEEDKERVRQFYQDKGYFMARVLDQKVTLRDVGGTGFRIPLFKPNKPGKRADITVPVEEGRLFHLSKMNFVGVKLFKTTDFLQKQIFQMQDGDVVSPAKRRKGGDQVKKLYGDVGYID